MVGMAGIDEHGEREGFVNAEGHGFSAAHQRHNRCLLLVEKSIAACIIALDVGNRVLFDANHIGQELGRPVARYHPIRRWASLRTGPATFTSRVGVISSLAAVLSIT
jgi:hypothetical protein